MSIGGYFGFGFAGLAIAALVFAIYKIGEATSQTLSVSTGLIAAERNQLAAESQRDKEKVRADKAEAENADLRAQLVSTQAALAKAGEESATNAADAVKNAPDPLAELNRQLSSSARSDVPDASNPGAGNGHQG